MNTKESAQQILREYLSEIADLTELTSKTWKSKVSASLEDFIGEFNPLLKTFKAFSFIKYENRLIQQGDGYTKKDVYSKQPVYTMDQGKIEELEYILNSCISYVNNHGIANEYRSSDSLIKNEADNRISKNQHYFDEAKEQMRLHNEKKIFISYSNDDKDVVNKFSSLILSNALNIHVSEQIFCTGIEGSKPKSGENFRERIKEELESASIVLQFISKSYRNSQICMNEMGAAWVLSGWVVPLIIERDDYEVGLIHSTTQQLQLTHEEDILQLIEDLEEKGIIKKPKSAVALTKVKEFVKWMGIKTKDVIIEEEIIPIVARDNEPKSPFYIINNRSNWYYKLSTKYYEIPDDLTKFYLGYDKNKTKVNRIQLGLRDEVLISEKPKTSVTRGEFFQQIGSQMIWLIFENKRHHVVNPYSFDLFRKEIQARGDSVPFQIVSESQIFKFPQGNPINFEGHL